MVVSDAHFAAQMVASGEEPIFFDDLGCLRDYLRQQAPPAGAALYVADHRSGAWVPAASALYTRLMGTVTPMGGGVVAHADEASRRADSIAAGGTRLPASAILGGKEGQ
jgi:copper chaperone NosL